MVNSRLFTATLLVFSACNVPAFAERVTKGNLVLEHVPEVPPTLADRTSQYQNTRSAVLRSWDPAGEGMLITTRFGNTAQVHYVARPLGTRRQLTFFNEPISNASFAPDAKYRGFLFSRDVGGGEFYQLYWFDLASGRSTLVTDGKSRNASAVWSNRGDRFVYTSTRRNGRDNDLYLASMADPVNARLALETKGSWQPLDWSPDDTRVVLLNYISINESYVHVLDLASGQLTAINAQGPGAETIAYGGARWTQDGKGLYLVSDQEGEFSQLRHLDLATGRQMVLTADIPWDVDGFELTPDGRTLAFTVNEGGRTSLYLLDTATRAHRRVEKLPLGALGGLEFSPDGARLGFTVNSSQTPGDVFVLTLATGALARWTESEIGGLDASKFVEPQIIAYPTFDEITPGKRREIPALVYRPATAPAAKKLPVLINIHGGPEGQSTVTFSPLTQFQVNEMGMAVIFPNVRGSTGYGKTYVKLDNGPKREDSVKDIGALLDWIAQQPDLDKDRVVVYGGSYGGYMVLASMTHYNDRLAAGIDVVGISNFTTFLSATQDYRRDLRRAEYGDERDPAMKAVFEKISPLNNIHKVSKPMLIAQGYNDPRVPVGEAEQVVKALKENGAQPWYFLAMDEGHGFAKKNNRDAFQNAMIQFLEEKVTAKK